MALNQIDNIGGSKSILDVSISSMVTAGTTSVYTETVTEDTLIFGIGYSTSYPSSNYGYMKLNGETVPYKDSMWSSGGSYFLSWIFVAPKGSTITSYYVRYYKITL